MGEGHLRALRRRLEGLPPSVSGISLGYVGLAGTIRYWLAEESGTLWIIVQVVSIPLFIVSACLLALATLRASYCLAKDVKSLAALSTYGAYSMSLALLARAVVQISGMEDGKSTASAMAYWTGFFGIYGAAILQFGVMCGFLWQAYKQKELPQPLWFPPTVSIAMTGWTGVSVGMPRPLVDASFWAGVTLMILFLPPAIVRTLKSPSEVAPNPSVFLLQAPASFLTVAWFIISDTSPSPLWLTWTLGGTSTLGWIITIVAAFQRRSILWKLGWNYGGWASFTFPTISTVNAALFLTTVQSNTLLYIWSRFLASLLLPLVAIILLYYTFCVVVRPHALDGRSEAFAVQEESKTRESLTDQTDSSLSLSPSGQGEEDLSSGEDAA